MQVALLGTVGRSPPLSQAETPGVHLFTLGWIMLSIFGALWLRQHIYLENNVLFARGGR